MSFKVEITEIKETLKMVQGKWGKVRDDPEVPYDYASNREELVKEIQVIYMQTVEELDLKEVISTVNAPKYKEDV